MFLFQQFYHNVKQLVKFTLELALKAQRGSRDIALVLLLTLALDQGEWSTPQTFHFNPREETWYPL
jgi:hypothetical protein